MATHVQIKESILIEIPKENLWEITALQFDKIGDWSAGVLYSEGNGTSALGAVCLERVCEPSYKGFEKTTERIVDYQPDGYQFTYEIVAGLPAMVEKATNTWTHIGRENETELTMEVNMHLKGIMGFLMKTPMQKRMKSILRQNLEELKVYAESGELHSRKKKLLKIA